MTNVSLISTNRPWCGLGGLAETLTESQVRKVQNCPICGTLISGYSKGGKRLHIHLCEKDVSSRCGTCGRKLIVGGGVDEPPLYCLHCGVGWNSPDDVKRTLGEQF